MFKGKMVNHDSRAVLAFLRIKLNWINSRIKARRDKEP